MDHRRPYRFSEEILRKMLLLLLFAMLAAGCAVPPSLVKPALEDEGEVYVYFEPFPPESGKVKFTLGSLSLVNADGTEFPLALVMTDISSALRRQQFLATGRIPPGQYLGLSCRVTKATLEGDEGETALFVPEEPVKVNFAFGVQRRKAVVLSLAFHYAGSIQGGFSFSPQFSLSIPPRPATGLMGYVVNHGDNNVTVFDKRSGKVASIITTGRGPAGVAFDQKAVVAYLSLSGEDAVDVLDMVEGSPTNRINVKSGDGPRDTLLTPDGRFLLTLDADSHTLSIIDPGSLIETSRIVVGEQPRHLLLDRVGRRCYVFNGRSNTLSIIDIANSAVVATLSLEAGPLMGQFNRKGDRLYIIHEGSPYLLVIDPSTLAVVRRVFVGRGLRFLKVDSMTDLIYAARDGDTRIEVYEPFSLNLIDYIPATSGIVYMTIDGESNNLFIVSAEKHALLSISFTSKNIVTETHIGEDPVWATMMGER
jgi:YVTN family beta-propeller protein